VDKALHLVPCLSAELKDIKSRHSLSFSECFNFTEGSIAAKSFGIRASYSFMHLCQMDFWQCMLHADLLHDYPEFLNKPESSLVCANNFRSAINLLQLVQRCSKLTNLIPTQGNVRYYVINVSHE